MTRHNIARIWPALFLLLAVLCLCGAAAIGGAAFGRLCGVAW